MGTYICTIEDLAIKYGNGGWVPCLEEGKQEKEICELVNVETWTERGWTQLYRVIRHQLASHKKMIRVLTHTGLVDVTDDHSLLLTCGTEVSPKEVYPHTNLMHCALTEKAIDENAKPIECNFFNEFVFYTMLDAAKFVNELNLFLF